MFAAMTPLEPNAIAVAETVQLDVIVSETLKVVVAVAASDCVCQDSRTTAAAKCNNASFRPLIRFSTMLIP